MIIEPNSCRLYKDLAWLWPLLSPLEEYEDEAAFFMQAVWQCSSTPVRTALHLGCGGGHLDYYFKQNLKVTGVDLNHNMLELARELNPDVNYVEGDMRAIRLNQVFDTVIVADSIAYMLTEADLQAAFQTAYTHLRPGGVFCTYAEQTSERFKQNFTSFAAKQPGDVLLTYFENLYDPNPGDTTFELTMVYLFRRRGKLQVEVDRHIAGLFSLEKWLRLLLQTGFEVVQDVMGEEGIPFFMCVKP